MIPVIIITAFAAFIVPILFIFYWEKMRDRYADSFHYGTPDQLSVWKQLKWNWKNRGRF